MSEQKKIRERYFDKHGSLIAEYWTRGYTETHEYYWIGGTDAHPVYERRIAPPTPHQSLEEP